MEHIFKNSKNKIAKKFDMPAEALLDIPKFIVIADNEVTVENHKGILSFKEDEIKLNTSLGVVTIKGKDFEILYLSQNTITLSGCFKSLEFERSDKNNGQK